MKFHIEREIAVSPQWAFDGMADVRNELHWNSRVSRAELRSKEPIRFGSRFVTINRGAVYDSMITIFDRPRTLAFDVTGKPMKIHVQFSFESIGANRTRLTGVFDMQPRGWMKLLGPLLKVAIQRDLPIQSASFGRWLESRANSPTI